MADVAKTAVRAECGVGGGGDEGEEEEPSLSAQIESELRGVLGKSWADPAGWATVEEVALNLTSPRLNGHAASQALILHENGSLLEDRFLHGDPSSPVKREPAEEDRDSAADLEEKESARDEELATPLGPVGDDLRADHYPDDSHNFHTEQDTNGEHDFITDHTTNGRHDFHTDHTPNGGHESPLSPISKGVTPDSEQLDSGFARNTEEEGSVEEEVRDCVDFVVFEVSSQETTTSTVNGDHIEETELSESTIIEKKVKKKKTVINGDAGEEVTTTKKKTKKTKKTEGKENNHISVISNGHDPEALPPSAMSHMEDNDLSNVCVKDLKLNYVNEANKSFNSPGKPSEVPVPATVPIRELAAQYWRTVSIENNLNENTPSIGRLDKSSFSKFDQLSKKAVLHVRSSDSAKAQKTFSQGSPDGQAAVLCKACQKQVFAMEQIKAERAVWHKNCFRCHTCNKQLTVDIYQSHEGLLYCKPHFRELFQPKAVVDEEEPVRRRKPEMIIRENQPVELPPDVVRASDKPDLGLEELSSLNVKSRFQVFEKQDQADGELERSPTTVSVKRSSSIMSKLAKFQKKGMDVGVTDESLNGFNYVETSSSEEESEEEDEEEDKGVIKCRRKARERPVSFGKMDDVKKNWESLNQSQRREEMREERKLELQQIRSRLFQGKQGKMKELYEQAVAESESKGGRKDSIKEDEELISLADKAKLARERFEKGDAGDGHDGSKKEIEEDMAVFEEGISKKSRNIFKEMEAAAKSSPLVPNHHPSPVARTDSVRRPRETDSPEREVYRDPDVVRCDDKNEEESTILRSQTASRMLSVFRQLEEQKEVLPDGPKPKKCFTPPPDFKGTESSEEEGSEEDEEEETDEEEEESENEEGVVKSSYKVKDEFLEQARNAARAKQLAAKFEQWEPEKQSTNNAINMLDSEHASIESTKSLKARFESLQNEQPKEKSRPKVNRFVEQPPATLCAFCDTKVYPLEKIETNGKIFHKNCFRCSYCNCILRMDTYTLNNGHLYCLPHFKQLFISKGNYDEGFGSDQHKRKWEQPVNGNTSS